MDELVLDGYFTREELVQKLEDLEYDFAQLVMTNVNFCGTTSAKEANQLFILHELRRHIKEKGRSEDKRSL